MSQPIYGMWLAASRKLVRLLAGVPGKEAELLAARFIERGSVGVLRW